MTRSGSSQLRTNNGGLATFTVDGKNQLTKVSLIPLTSDGNGNLIFDKLSKHSSVGYGYDDENRLQNWYSYADEGGG